jgi:hypothetical protein
VGGCFVPAFLVSARHDVFHAWEERKQRKHAKD